MPELFVPPGIRYVCVRCGQCCRTLEVTLTQAEHDRLAAHDWSGELADWAPDRVFAPLPRARGRQVWRLRPLASGACRFLTHDNRCLVHATLGYGAKPFAGRLFPFTFTLTPLGVFVGVRFNCPAVARGKGPELETQRHDIQRFYEEYARLYDPPCAPERVRFHAGFELSWGDVLRLEHQLLEFLLARQLDLARRLLACRRLVRRFLVAAASRTDGTRVGVEPGEVLAEAAAAAPQGAQGLSATERALARLFVATFLGATLPSFRELSAAGRTRVRLANVGRRLRLAFGRGAAALPGIEGAVPVADVDGADALPLDVPSTRMLERFYVAKIASQGFFGQALFGRSFVQGVDFLAASYPAVLWLARAHAMAAGRSGAGADDIEYAVRTVDHGFGYVPAFGAGLDRTRAYLFRVWGTLDRLLLALSPPA